MSAPLPSLTARLSLCSWASALRGGAVRSDRAPSVHLRSLTVASPLSPPPSPPPPYRRVHESSRDARQRAAAGRAYAAYSLRCSASGPAASSSSTSTSAAAAASAAAAGFVVEDETIAFRRYQTVYERTVRFPDGKRISYDVLGQPSTQCASVLVFPYDSRTRTVTMIREYCPGTHEMLLGFPAGMAEAKHDTFAHAARAELSEEAGLVADELIELTARCDVKNGGGCSDGEGGGVRGVPADKYAKNVMKMYLALGCRPDPTPGALDDEEYIEVEPRVSLPQLEQYMQRGMVTAPHMLLALYALDYMRKRHWLDDGRE